MARVRYVNFMNYHSEFIEELNKLAPPSGSPKFYSTANVAELQSLGDALGGAGSFNSLIKSAIINSQNNNKDISI